MTKTFWEAKSLEAFVYVAMCILSLVTLWVIRIAITKGIYEANKIK